MWLDSPVCAAVMGAPAPAAAGESACACSAGACITWCRRPSEGTTTNASSSHTSAACAQWV
ncbi:MAG: hypothetical protein B7X79_19445 [Acidovorax sp. 17-64-282]|nr:MAG: hypothetical protein B7Y64_13595 [Acidovorax sp. 35-64-16]OYY86668.1 MAG: hypothetical protein B7Y46_04595 [Acidovorax sp. 28-64-14]OYZ45334.1 MAG: hypothetical protein B7Y20_07355 [Acidovorax sp. 16-64-162]OZA52341.1 MAG: hypothetical protein B7X79_19445 [Acidovorax sp. 17-64-282]OZA69798.1 MAG: hypothetical protein B7X70_09625 [Acidovorax sp. 39-64-12]